MSLINEALKKAQRLRHEGTAAGAAPDADAGGPIAKRAQPKSARSMLLIAVGAVVLIVISMVGTAWWLTRPTQTAEIAATKPARALNPVVKEETLPAINPVVTLPAAAATPEPVVAPNDAPPAKTKSAPSTASTGATKPTVKAQPKAVAATPATSPRTSAEPAPVETAPIAKPADASPTTPKTKVAAEAPKPDERIHQFVEALKVTGIRSSGTDSKVLMNDRVYRVNDIVDRALGVRLTKVDKDNLTFTDANGATYVKYF